MTNVARDTVPSPPTHEAISPYLRRPLRSLKQYLKERNRSRDAEPIVPSQPESTMPEHVEEPPRPEDGGRA